jgi:hypothetical protein
MNYVYAEGSTKTKRQLAEDVVNFCIGELMPRMKTLEVGVQLSNDLKTHQYGFCCAIDTREFEIEVNAKLSTDDLITTICHEMVHVKQYARKELDINNESNYQYYEEYLNLWYEKEAREFEVFLREKYKSLI